MSQVVICNFEETATITEGKVLYPCLEINEKNIFQLNLIEHNCVDIQDEEILQALLNNKEKIEESLEEILEISILPETIVCPQQANNNDGFRVPLFVEPDKLGNA